MSQWRPIPSFPGYFADASGQILGKRGKVLAQTEDKAGYRHVTLFRDGRAYFSQVSRLVCAAFYGPPPTAAHEAAHNDGVSSNNTSGNLRWATPVENSADRVQHGTDPKGERNPRATISAEKVGLIRADIERMRLGQRLPAGGRSILCRKHGVSLHILKDILSNRSWV